MEDLNESNLRGKRIRDFFFSNWLLIDTFLFFFGLTVAVGGGVCYLQTFMIEHAVVLATGLIVMLMAIGVWAIWGLQNFSLRQQTTEPTFNTFMEQSEEFSSNKEQHTIAKIPDLEMNDQHLPSGILRLREDI